MTGWFDQGQEPRSGEFQVQWQRDLVSAAEVWALLREHSGAGWICTTDRVRRVPCDDLGDAPPLSAEIALSPTRSLHLRQSGTGWRAWMLEDRLGDGPHLCIEEILLSTERPSKLRYRTWWRLEVEQDELKVWRPFASRLLGWEDR